jgi:predicted esterase
MEYATKEYGIHPRLNNVEPEKMQLDEALAVASTILKVDSKMVFMGGFSQGGYSTSVLGEYLLDRLAGLIILGAGRTMVDGYPPPKKSLWNKPIFIGVGENDTVHNPRAKNAVQLYKLWGAEVTFEEWTGVGHTFDNTRSTKLHDWLLSIAAMKSGKAK